MITKTAMKPDSPIYAQGVESVNRCSDFVPNSEVVGNTLGAFAVGLTPQIIARFWSKVQRGDGCWLWMAATFPTGYGQFNAGRFLNGKQDTRYAHRVAYELAHGPIPDGLVVRHQCDTPRCVRASHLLIGTQADNIADAQRQGKYKRQRPGKWTVPGHVRAAVLAAPRTYGAMADLARLTGYPMKTLAAIRRRALARGNAHV